MDKKKLNLALFINILTAVFSLIYIDRGFKEGKFLVFDMIFLASIILNILFFMIIVSDQRNHAIVSGHMVRGFSKKMPFILKILRPAGLISLFVSGIYFFPSVEALRIGVFVSSFISFILFERRAF